MAITSAVCTSYKVELAQGLHNHTASTGNTFKMALYTSAATLSAATTAYSATNEVANGNGYITGGATLTNITPSSSGTTAFWSWSDVSWTTATITARGCMVYNTTSSNRAVFVQDFGGDISSTSGTFSVNFPTNNNTTAILRLA